MKTKPPRFIIKPKWDHSNTPFRTVAVAHSDDDEYGRKIGELYHHKEKGVWGIYDTELTAIKSFVAHLRFGSDGEAANFLWIVLQGCENITTARPLPTAVERYLEERARALGLEEEVLLSRFLGIRLEQLELRQFAKDNKLPKLDDYTAHSDGAAAVRKLLGFCREGHDEAFFSEASLYDLVGKEDARTILALVGKVCDSLAPNISRGMDVEGGEESDGEEG